MERVGDHPVTAGPLSVRWLAVELEPPRAGALGVARIAIENAGLATWRPLAGSRGVKASYHWLDPLGNALLWDGLRSELPHEVAPGARVELDLAVRAVMPPGRYRLGFDLVDESRRWFAAVGSFQLDVDVDVVPRIERRLAVVGGEAPGQEEPLVPLEEAAAVARLVPGVEPAPDWSRRVLDAHQEGFAVVGGSIVAPVGLLQRQAAELAAWAHRGGRNPGFADPLLCASVVVGIEPVATPDVAGLPGMRAPEGEPWVYDARITARRRSGHRPA